MNQLDPKREARSFWSKPEGTTGMIVGIGGAAGIGALLFTWLPAIIGLLSNVLTAIALLAAIAAVVFVLVDSRFRNALGYLYKVAMRKLTGLIIQIDPVAIVLDYVAQMKKNRAAMEEQIGNLAGQIRRLDSVIGENKNQMSKNMSVAKKARDTGKQELAGLKAMAVGRLEDSNAKLSELKTKMDGVHRVLLKMHEVSGMVIDDTEEQVKLQIREREAIQAGYSAFRSAMKIIKGDPDKLEDFNTTMDFMAEDVSRKVGEMEVFMITSRNFIEGVEMDKAQYIEKGLRMLDEWEKQGESALLGKSVKTITGGNAAKTSWEDI